MALLPLRTPVTQSSVRPGDLYRFLANVVSKVNSLDATVDSIVTELKRDAVIDSPRLAIGSDTSAVSFSTFDFEIAGVRYTKAGDATGVEPGNDVIPQSKYGAVAYDITTTGVITVVEASGNATGYDSAALAVAALPAVAASHVRMGWVTATKSDGTFTFGTTALNAANSTVAYTNAARKIDGLYDVTAVSETDNLTLQRGV